MTLNKLFLCLFIMGNINIFGAAASANSSDLDVTGLQRELVNAIVAHDISKVKELVNELGVGIIFVIQPKHGLGSRFTLGATPIHLAAQFDSKALQFFLVDKEAPVNLNDNDGNSLLHYALKSGIFDKPLVVQMLLNRNIDITQNKDGVTPLMLEVEFIKRNPKAVTQKEFGQEKIYTYIAEELDSDGKTCEVLKKYTLKDISYPYVRAFNAMLKRTNLKLQDKDGLTVLHYAVRQSLTDLVKTLLQQDKILIRIQDKAGLTSIHYAVIANAPDIVQALIEADPEAVLIETPERVRAIDIADKEHNDVIFNILRSHHTKLKAKEDAEIAEKERQIAETEAKAKREEEDQRKREREAMQDSDDDEEESDAKKQKSSASVSASSSSSSSASASAYGSSSSSSLSSRGFGAAAAPAHEDYLSALIAGLMEKYPAADFDVLNFYAQELIPQAITGTSIHVLVNRVNLG